MSAPTLKEMETRAQRQLDGMTVNRDAMALDVLRLCEAIRVAHRRAAERPEAKPEHKPKASQDYDLFGGIFGEIFGGRYK